MDSNPFGAYDLPQLVNMRFEPKYILIKPPAVSDHQLCTRFVCCRLHRARFRRVHAEIFSGILEDGVAEGRFSVANTKVAAACIAGAIPTALIGPLAPESHELEANGEKVVEDIVQFCLSAVQGAASKQKSEQRISA